MNYGYDENTPGWKDSLKFELGIQLSQLVHDFDTARKFDNLGPTAKPYVEIDQLYRGVRIRKITHLKPEVEEELLKEADALYHRIMEG